MSLPMLRLRTVRPNTSPYTSATRCPGKSFIVVTITSAITAPLDGERATSWDGSYPARPSCFPVPAILYGSQGRGARFASGGADQRSARPPTGQLWARSAKPTRGLEPRTPSLVLLRRLIHGYIRLRLVGRLA